MRNAPAVRVLLILASIFIFFASALWALLPLLARAPLGLGSGGYALLLSCMGVGSVLGATVLPSLRRKFSQDTTLLLSPREAYLKSRCLAAWLPL